jgi:hypothetical protein
MAFTRGGCTSTNRFTSGSTPSPNAGQNPQKIYSHVDPLRASFRACASSTYPTLGGTPFFVFITAEGPRSLWAEGSVQLSAFMAVLGECIDPCLGVLGFAKDRSASK